MVAVRDLFFGRHARQAERTAHFAGECPARRTLGVRVPAERKRPVVVLVLDDGEHAILGYLRASEPAVLVGPAEHVQPAHRRELGVELDHVGDGAFGRRLVEERLPQHDGADRERRRTVADTGGAAVAEQRFVCLRAELGRRLGRFGVERGLLGVRAGDRPVLRSVGQRLFVVGRRPDRA